YTYKYNYRDENELHVSGCAEEHSTIGDVSKVAIGGNDCGI
ncbi:23326_t:CDS:1, partial [Gigaspora rosea]